MPRLPRQRPLRLPRQPSRILLNHTNHDTISYLLPPPLLRPQKNPGNV